MLRFASYPGGKYWNSVQLTSTPLGWLNHQPGGGFPLIEMARKQILLRLTPQVYDAIAKWAADDLRSVNAQIEYLLRQNLKTAGREPKHIEPMKGPGRPKQTDQ